MSDRDDRPVYFPLKAGEDGVSLYDSSDPPKKILTVEAGESAAFFETIINIGIVVFDINAADIDAVIKLLKRVQIENANKQAEDVVKTEVN